jgi:hypothetical protein
MADFARVASTVLRRYVKGAEPTLLRSIKALALMESMGLFETNISGDGIDWAVEYQRAPVQANAGNTPLEYNPVDRFLRCYLDMRGYVATDAMGKREFLKAKGSEALIKYFSEMPVRLMNDIKRAIGGVELYVDGDATGNSERIHGFFSFLRFDTTMSLNKDTGVARAYNAADYVFLPDGSYAGLDMDLGAYGGVWGAGWPEQAATQYAGVDTFDFFSPIGVNYKSSSFGGATQTWKDQCREACLFMSSALDKDGTEEGKADLGLLDRRMMRELKQTLIAKEKLEINAKNVLTSLGLDRDSLVVDGITYSGEWGVPAGNGIVLNTKKLALHSWQSKMFMPEGPDYHKQDREYRSAVDMLANMTTESPKYHGRFLAV